MYDLTIILPTLNEAGSIAKTITLVNKYLTVSNINGQILVVDDNSKDGTYGYVQQMRMTHPNVDILVRNEDHGLSQSLVDGFNHATTDIIMVMDSDGQHPFEKIPEIYQAILDGNDIALGSRYMGIPGSGFEGLAYHRRLISWGATVLSRFFFPSITDSGSGFFAFRKAVIKDAPLKPQGFRMLFEILGKGHWKTAKEIPIIFGVRKKGESKLTTKTILDYLKQLWGLLDFSLTHTDSHGHAELTRLMTFMAVGATGIFVNLGVLYLATEWLGIYYIWSGFIGVEASIISNFVLNDLITFKDITKTRYSTMTRMFMYHLVCIGGSGISLILLILLTTVFGVWYLAAAAIGILIAFLWNFTANRGFTWVEG
jgi:dolichol-phosphate mannosyltransferase